MPIRKHFLEFRCNDQRRGERTENPHRRLELDFIPQNRAVFVRFDDMLMPPAFKRTGNLHVFKLARRIVFRVFGDPARRNQAENFLLDNRNGRVL